MRAIKQSWTRLRSHGTTVAPESRDAQTRTVGLPPHENWQFDDPAEQFKHDTTAKLVADLTAFVDPDPHKGLLSDVHARLAFAESVERETLVKYEAAWKRAIESIAASPKYHGLTIRPQLGLIPIDQDPKSGLWEFVHLQTVGPRHRPDPEARRRTADSS